ncbi:MAG TPA: hypothetical protein PKD32_09520 [Saprospiraceae bacterium]|nr:hypothetical protein [Saprospiraceae bacterium]
MINHSRKKLFLLIPIVLLLVLPIIILFLWNWIVVDLFGVKSIGYLQALGLFVLSRILFGSYGFRGKPRRPFGHQYKDSWMSMTEEEKAKIKEEWRKRRSCND